MFEKVNPQHPDKVADRIAGAFVDLAYKREKLPRVAVEVLVGHEVCHVIAESSVEFSMEDACSIVERITGDRLYTDLLCVPQDKHLADNQQKKLHCRYNNVTAKVTLLTKKNSTH